MSRRSILWSGYAALVVALAILLAGCRSGAAGSKPWWDFWKKEPKAGEAVSDIDMLPPPPPLDNTAELKPNEIELPAIPSYEDIEKKGGLEQTTPIREPTAGVVAGLKPVFFSYDSAELDSSARTALEADAGWLLSHKDTQVQVEGHCDERGTREYNFALGERRALTVRNYLASKGVPANNLVVISYGEERPVAPGHEEQAWAQNRRVQFLGYR